MNDAQVEEIKRHVGVAEEALRSDIRQVAEGHSGIGRELQDIRDEFRDEFREMRALMRLSFSQLDLEDSHARNQCFDIEDSHGPPRNHRA